MKNRKAFFMILAAVVVVIMSAGGAYYAVRHFWNKEAESTQAMEQLLIEKGPWGENSVWKTEENESYLVSNLNPGEKFASVKAYILEGEEYKEFSINLGYNSALILSRLENDKVIPLIDGSFDFDGTTLTFSNLTARGEADVSLPETTFNYQKAGNYEEEIKNLPFKIN